MFDAFEQSRFAGRPVHLFVFTYQRRVLRFAAADHDIVIGEGASAVTYTAAQIQRSEIKQTTERAKDKITITAAYLRDPSAAAFPATQPLGDLWHPYIPSDTVRVTCLATHVGDTDPPRVEWMGVVVQPKYSDVELELTCTPSADLDRARGQGARFQRACWKTVYGTGLWGCNLDPTTYQVDAVLTGISGLSLTATAFAGAPLNLAGGSLQWTTPAGLIERRSIMSHSGTGITLLYGAAAADLPVGTAVIARPGCPRTWAACAARGNTIHFGGAIYKPVDNPLDGVSMTW